MARKSKALLTAESSTTFPSDQALAMSVFRGWFVDQIDSFAETFDRGATVVMTGNVALTADSALVQAFDPNGADREVSIAAAANTQGRVFMIRHAGTGDTLLVRDQAAAALVRLGPGGLVIASCDGTNVQVLFSTPQAASAFGASSIAALQALDPAVQTHAYLSAGDRSGLFTFQTGTQAGAVLNDPLGGVFIPPDTDLTGGSGAWRREFDGLINVRWFGALGDDVTDDQAALQAAENFCNLRGGNLWIPEGNYRLSDGITKFSGVSWFGESQFTTIIEPTAASTATQVFLAASRSDFELADMQFRATDRMAALGNAVTVFRSFGTTTDISVRRCRFLDLQRDGGNSNFGFGLGFTVPTDILVQDCYFDNCERGVLFSNRTERVKLINNRARQMRNNAFAIISDPDGGEDIWWEGNHVDEQNTNQSQFAITAGSTDDLSNGEFTNVWISNNKAFGQGIGFNQGGSADQFSLKDCRDMTVIGNHSEGGGDLGYAIERCRRVSVVGNVAKRNNAVGISIFLSNYVTVSGNTCMNNRQDIGGFFFSGRYYGGIRLEESSEFVSVTGNICSDDQAPGSKTQEYGIVFLENTAGPGIARNLTISGNHCDGNKWGPIFGEPQAVDAFSLQHRITSRVDVFDGAEHSCRGVEWYNTSALAPSASPGKMSVFSEQSFLNADHSAADTLITVGATALMATGDYCYILLDDDSIHTSRFTVTSSNTVTLDIALPSSATSGEPFRHTRWADLPALGPVSNP